MKFGEKEYEQQNCSEKRIPLKSDLRKGRRIGKQKVCSVNVAEGAPASLRQLHKESVVQGGRL